MALKKVLCCADLHLGRSSLGIQFPTGTDLSAVGAWKRVVDAAIDQRADVVVIAGDIFDGMSAYNAARHDFKRGLERLEEADIPTVAVAGNHDHDSLRSFVRTYKDSGLTVLGLSGEWDSEIIKGIEFIGWSFQEAYQKLPAISKLAFTPRTSTRIGVLHGDIASQSSIYHPIDPKSLLPHADAWVLGHIHKPAVIENGKVVYPGSPQAFDFGPGEQGLHGYFWLFMESGEVNFSEIHPVSTVAYFTQVSLTCDASSIPVKDAVELELEAYCQAKLAETPFLESVQIRALVSVTGVLTVDVDIFESPSIQHGFSVDQITVIREHALWDLVESVGPQAEIARLLMASRAVRDFYQNRLMPQEWAASYSDLQHKVADDLERLWKQGFANTAMPGDEEKQADPTREDLINRADLLIKAQLEAELNRLELEQPQSGSRLEVTR